MSSDFGLKLHPVPIATFLVLITFKKHKLNFLFEAGTSRGKLVEKTSWMIRISENDDSASFGLGEAGIIPGLSRESNQSIEAKLLDLQKVVRDMNMPKTPPKALEMADMLTTDADTPSVRFALETAFLDHLNGGVRRVFGNAFWLGKMSIPINGLIWMGDLKTMARRVEEKLEHGFSCIKIKIGAISFEEEFKLLTRIRGIDSSVTIRVDANGAFDPATAMQIMKKLAKLHVHSIEQPIAANRWPEMKEICASAPIPIALDEELIGAGKRKKEMLEFIRPQYVILKPGLIGGFRESAEWIDIASNLDIGWWLTSALESNIGLNAIAQFAAEKAPEKIHGLGTGKLYSNNIDSPLTITNGRVRYNSSGLWDYHYISDIL